MSIYYYHLITKSTPFVNLFTPNDNFLFMPVRVYSSKGGANMNRFRELRQEKHLTQAEMIQRYNERYGRNYSIPALSQMENNKRTPEMPALIDFADFFGVSVDYLLGLSNDKQHSALQGQDGEHFLLFDGQIPPPRKRRVVNTDHADRARTADMMRASLNHAHYKIPILGAVAAGEPLEAVENILGYEYLDDRYKGDGYQYFALKIRGNSMTPTIMDGDVVIVRQQPTVDSGQIAIVLVDGENATAKQIDISPSGITVIGHNASVFAPRFVPNAEVKARLQILGRVMEVRRRF
jgi:SOS-response transcriptional repressor LexA